MRIRSRLPLPVSAVLLPAVPHKALYGPATRATVAMGALILLILGLGLAAALAVARHISRPVESLREAAERLGHSEPVAAPATGTVELDAVGQAMSQASARLRGTTAEPFYTTKGVGKGSGMGLAQAYGFARQNGGTVRLESRPGQGTTVSIFLPRAREPLTPRAERPVTGLPAGERYDALLTDVVMPGKLNGLVTGYFERAVELPGVRALAKPFDVQQAVEALNEAMSSG